MHWSTDPSWLASHLPTGLEVDLFGGEAFVGIVPFEMKGVRPAWAPPFTAFQFLETNLRVYVTCDGEPGVYFFSLDAASRIAVWTARLGWSLPYHYAHMMNGSQAQQACYHSQRPRSERPELSVAYQVGERLPESKPESIEYFLLERYLLFTERKGVLQRGQVHHTPYPVHQCQISRVEQSLTEHIHMPLLEHPPRFAHFSPGVDVEVFSLTPKATRSAAASRQTD